MAFCLQCGNEIKEGAKFCAKCGVEVPATVQATPVEKKCASCGTVLKDGVKFCPKCGNKVDGAIPAVQSGNQYAMPPAQGIPQNNASNTANKTVTCQGCLLNNNISAICTYYNCTISEAEKYDCGMRGVPELQKKQKNSRTIRFIVIFLLAFLVSYFLKPIESISEALGVNYWIIFICFFVIVCMVEHFINKNTYKKRRKNAKRLS